MDDIEAKFIALEDRLERLEDHINHELDRIHEALAELRQLQEEPQ